jgi:hypothetical protein
MRASSVWLVALWLVACAPAAQDAGPVQVCVKVGERCKLGVCHADPRQMARLVCLSQH